MGMGNDRDLGVQVSLNNLSPRELAGMGSASPRVSVALGLLGARLVVDGQKMGPWMTTGVARKMRDQCNSDPFFLSAFLATVEHV